MKQTAPSVSPMSNEARNSYVIEQITEALIGLLRTKPIGEVSISELCAAAGVGRASFYRNFESKEAVLQRKDEALLRQWQKDYDAAAAQAKAAGREPENLMASLLLFYKKNQDILKIAGPAQADANIAAYAKAFIAYGIYGMVCEWIRRGMTESAEALAILMQQEQGK